MSLPEVKAHVNFLSLHPDCSDYTHELISSSALTREYVLTASGTSYSLPTAIVVGEGVAALTGTAYSGVTNVSPTQFNKPIGTTLALDRNVFVRVRVGVLVEAPAGASLSIQKLNGLCLACSPLSRVMNNVAVTINNNTITSMPALLAPTMHRFIDSADFRKTHNSYPNQPDAYNTINAQVFAAGGLMTAEDAATSVDTLVESCAGPCNPFAAASASGYAESRSQFGRYSIKQLPRTADTLAGGEKLLIEYEVCEPLFNPFFDSCNVSHLARVKDLSINIGWNDLSGMFTIAPGLILAASADGVTLVQACRTTLLGFTSAPELLYRTYMPTFKMDPVIKMPYDDYYRERLQIGTEVATTNTDANVSSGGFQWNTVPKRIFVFATPRGVITSKSQTDAYLAITKFTLNTNKLTGNFSGATPQQLHAMSVRNGLNMSYTDWRRKCGSIICIDVSKGDLGAFTPGVREPFNFDITCTVSNTQVLKYFGVRAGVISGSAVEDTTTAVAATITQWDLQIIGEIPGEMELDGDNCTLTLGTDRQIADALTEQAKESGGPGISDAPLPVGGHETRGGSSWLSRTWNKHIRKNLVKAGLSVWHHIQPAAKMLGHGINNALGAASLGLANRITSAADGITAQISGAPHPAALPAAHQQAQEIVAAGVKAMGYGNSRIKHRY